METVTEYIWLHLPETRKLELNGLLVGVLKEKKGLIFKAI